MEVDRDAVVRDPSLLHRRWGALRLDKGPVQMWLLDVLQNVCRH